MISRFFAFFFIFLDFNVSNGRRRGHDELFFQCRDLVVSLLRHLLLGFLVLFERFDLFLELFGFLFELLVVGLRLGMLGADDVDGHAKVFRRGALELPGRFPSSCLRPRL